MATGEHLIAVKLSTLNFLPAQGLFLILNYLSGQYYELHRDNRIDKVTKEITAFFVACKQPYRVFH